MMAYMIIDLQNTRDTCALRSEAVTFWLYVYQSSAVANIAASRQYAILPAVVLDQLKLISLLTNGVLCNGSPAIKQVTTSSTVLSLDTRFTFTATILSSIYEANVDGATIQIRSFSSQVAFDQFIKAETDVAIFVRSELSVSSLSDAVDSGNYLIFPAYMSALSPAFDPQLTSNVNIGSYSVVADMNIIRRILLGNISHWRDDDILALNPFLVTLFGSNESAPITRVMPCGSGLNANAMIQ